MPNNYYVWKDIDWIVLMIGIFEIFAVLPVVLIFESMFDEVNQRLPPARRFPGKTISRWWGIIRTHRELVPDSRARRMLWYFLAAAAGLLAALILRVLYLSAASSGGH